MSAIFHWPSFFQVQMHTFKFDIHVIQTDAPTLYIRLLNNLCQYVSFTVLFISAGISCPHLFGTRCAYFPPCGWRWSQYLWSKCNVARILISDATGTGCSMVAYLFCIYKNKIKNNFILKMSVMKSQCMSRSFTTVLKLCYHLLWWLKSLGHHKKIRFWIPLFCKRYAEQDT